MSDVLADTETYGPVYAAIAHVWGERCSDYEPGCPCCDAWAEYDRLSNASAENEKLDRDYQSARDAHDKMLAENEKLRAALRQELEGAGRHAARAEGTVGKGCAMTDYMCPADPTVTHCYHAAKVNEIICAHTDTIAALTARVEELEGALDGVLPLAESYLNIMPDRHGIYTPKLESARAALEGKQ